ncbi:6059_t:CDS:2 [Acaulospora colombiana]|uniref:6059_t:CDS:1 n=1 Tax=Acaulospora colombiana TaxID=27376 RepID=A0ACA9PF89_9GLOM|nr:6059_t:CDS:2 [Acaulospora colombiana]
MSRRGGLENNASLNRGCQLALFQANQPLAFQMGQWNRPSKSVGILEDIAGEHASDVPLGISPPPSSVSMQIDTAQSEPIYPYALRLVASLLGLLCDVAIMFGRSRSKSASRGQIAEQVAPQHLLYQNTPVTGVPVFKEQKRKRTGSIAYGTHGYYITLPLESNMQVKPIEHSPQMVYYGPRGQVMNVLPYDPRYSPQSLDLNSRGRPRSNTAHEKYIVSPGASDSVIAPPGGYLPNEIGHEHSKGWFNSIKDSFRSRSKSRERDSLSSHGVDLFTKGKWRWTWSKSSLDEWKRIYACNPLKIPILLSVVTVLAHPILNADATGLRLDIEMSAQIQRPEPYTTPSTSDIPTNALKSLGSVLNITAAVDTIPMLNPL